MIRRYYSFYNNGTNMAELLFRLNKRLLINAILLISNGSMR
jgi:hypothetical protein